MYRISLVNMPFASLALPSIALTQLKSVIDSAHGDRASVNLLYLNHDFGRFIGTEHYQRIAVDPEAPYNGFGDWFFRQAAFPQLADNTEVYFQRYFPHRNQRNEELKRFMEEKRQGLDRLLETLIDSYQLDQADLVGFTSMFSQNVASFAMARKIKERNPDTVIVIGGANCETPMGQEIIKNVEHVDFVFSGTALKSFPQFLRCCLDQDMRKCHRIKGVFSKANYATMPLPASIGEELSLDVPVALDYEPFLDALDGKFPSGEIKPILLFETSRGCWWGERAHCTFCGLNGTTMDYRSMRPENARNVIQSLFKHSSRVSRLQCVDNIMPKNYPKEVFAGLDTPANMTIFYEVKADLTENDMQILSKARVREVQPGIEALSTFTLKLMRKGTTVFQNLALLKNCVRYGISPDWSILVAFPGENEEVYKKYLKDIPSLVHLPPPNGAFPVRPDRYSPYFVQAEEYGLDLRPSDFYQLVYPFSKESVTNMAYFFRDYNFGAEYFRATVAWLGQVREKVEMWQRRWNHADHGLPPMLYVEQRGDPTVVYDSRSGEVVEHQLSNVGCQVLEGLARPRRVAELAAELGHLPNLNLAEELASLKERGLVFEEGQHLMSLVLPERPSGAEELTQWSWAR